MTTTQTETKTKKRTPIAPPEHMIPETTESTEDKPKRQTMTWAVIFEPERGTELQAFENVTELRNFLKAGNGREILGEFVVRGWAKPIIKSQTVSF